MILDFGVSGDIASLLTSRDNHDRNSFRRLLIIISERQSRHRHRYALLESEFTGRRRKRYWSSDG